MKLSDLLTKPGGLRDGDVLFVRRPWGPDSEVVVSSLTSDFRVPEEVKAEGFEYFLEWHVAEDVLGVLSGRQAPPSKRVDLLLYYAENDAYPGWVYD